ncbi:MAG: glycerol-3-phosphate dehydrogenase/oxidase [Pirellulaceae bacterium]|nr:glycerol-3-phosphate dehydrogenase/oxidase [Pirellulaceae bacterium]
MNRQEMLQRISDSPQDWDVLVIGGGATGLGVAWNAAAAGYRTLVLEAHDFAQGTSSRSTKLIHGGVRYLRQGQLGMVRSALHEREYLLQSARSLVWPLHIVIPSYRLGSRWYYYAGLKVYDWLAGKRNMQPAKCLSRRQVATLLPNLQTDGLRGGVEFCDGQFDDARLALCVARTVVANRNCAVLNYARVVSIDSRQSDRRRIVRFQDTLTSQQTEVIARVVINATGVFAEQVSRCERSVGQSEHAIRISPSRGTHLVLPAKFLSSGRALMIPHTDDGRVLFAIPWQNRTLLGTTDIATDSIDIEPLATEYEIDYLLEHVSRYLAIRPSRRDVLSVFSGLRPLLGKSNQASTAQLSREHEIVVSSSGLISIIGGKWTTFRKMGRDALKLAIQVGGLPPKSEQPLTLIGGDDVSQSQGKSEAAARKLHPQLPITAWDVQQAVQQEMAETLEDVLARRTRCLLLDANASQQVAGQVVQLMQQLRGSNPAWAQQQLAEFQQLAQKYTVATQSP